MLTRTHLALIRKYSFARILLDVFQIPSLTSLTKKTPSNSIMESPACKYGEYSCANGKCVPESARCNRIPDCADQSDEWDCPAEVAPTAAPSCLHNEFQCRNGQCIPSYRKCDSRPDCSDYSDEQDCLHHHDHSRPNPPGVPTFDLKTYPNDQIIKESKYLSRFVLFQMLNVQIFLQFLYCQMTIQY